MRLTNTIRTAFVNAAMHDVPTIDYEEQAQKLGRATLTAALPPAVQKLIKDAATEQYVNREYITMPSRFSNFYHYASRNNNSVLKDQFPAVYAQIEALHAQNEMQLKSMRELRTKLQACSDAATTRKALVEMLPEFEKYLPEDEAKANRSLPVVSNVVSDFVKAGWPKTQSKGNAK